MRTKTRDSEGNVRYSEHEIVVETGSLDRSLLSIETGRELGFDKYDTDF